MSNYKLFPNLHIIQVSREYAGIYHPLNQKILYIPRPYLNILNFFKTPHTVSYCIKKFRHLPGLKPEINKLIKLKVLVDSSFDSSKEMARLGAFFGNKKPELKVAYVFLSEDCNLNCRYCYIKCPPTDGSKRSLPINTALDIVRFFANNVTLDKQHPPLMIYYGGEPLLNFPAIVAMTDELRQLERKGKFGNLGLQISMVTNGTLITPKIAEYLVTNRISAAISIDGPKEIHNNSRKYRTGPGTFDDSLRGYNLIKKLGGDAGISCTMGTHNVNKLEDIADFFINELKPSSVGFNIMIGGPNALRVPPDRVTYNLLKAFEILRQAGTYEDRIMRRLSKLVAGKPYPYDCAACGNQLVFLINGDYGPCHSFCHTRKYFFGNIYEPNHNIFNNPIMKMWRSRTPFNMAKCRNCSVISICGGGCAYEVETQTGSFWGKDKRYCVHCKMLIDWCLSDIFRTYKGQKHYLDRLFVVDRKTKGELFGNIKVAKFPSTRKRPTNKDYPSISRNKPDTRPAIQRFPSSHPLRK